MKKTNWKIIVSELSSEMKLADVAKHSGLASAGHVHGIKTGKQVSVEYDVGVKLMDMHKFMKARQSKIRTKAKKV